MNQLHSEAPQFHGSVALPLPARSWRPAAVGTLRFACLPASVLGGLQFGRSVAALEEIEHHRTRLKTDLMNLTDELGAAVPGVQDQLLRRALINTRRCLHQQKCPAPRDQKSILDTGGRLAELLAQACEALQEQARLEADFPGILAAEYAERQQAWKEQLLAYPDLLTSLAVVAPDVMDSLDHYLTAPSGASLTQWRKLELTLATYWSRAATKTSPMSRLTYTAVTDWDSAGQSTTVCAAASRADLYTAVQLHRVLVRTIFEAVTHLPDLSQHWTWKLHPQIARDPRQWHLRSRAVPASQARAHQRITVPATPALQAIAAMLTKHPLTLPELSQTLQFRAPAVDVLQLNRYLSELTRLQILIPALQLEDDTPEPLQLLAEELRRLDHPTAGSLAVQLAALNTDLRTFAQQDHRSRRQTSIVLQAHLRHLLQVLELPETLPTRLLYEDSAARVQTLSVPAVVNRPSAEMNAVATLATLCSPSTLERLNLVERFVRLHGVGQTAVRPLEFFLAEEAPSEEVPSDVATMTYLQRLDVIRTQHRKTVQALLTLVAERQHQGQEEIVLDLEWIHALASETDVPLPSRAMTILLQPTVEGDLVVNGVLPGHGLLLTRLQAVGGPEEDQLQEAFKAAAGLYAPARPVQVVVSSDSTMNAFPSPLPTALRGPDATTRREQDLLVQQCTLRHDPERHELALQHPSGEPLMPIYLGAYAPTFLTSVEQALIGLTPGITANLDLPGLLRRQRAGQEPSTAVVSWPRVRLGSLILSRRTWMIQTPEELHRQPGDSDQRYWGRLRSWAHQQHLPLQFFGVPDTQWRQQSTSLNDMMARSARLKPQYFDLDNFFLVRVFERWVLESGRCWAWQEVAPAPGAAGVELVGDRHVTELGVELHLVSGEHRA